MLGSLGVKAAANDNTVLLPPARTFDTLTADAVGGLYFSFEKYGVQAESASFSAGADPSANAAPQPANRSQEFAVSGFNVENLYDYRDDPFDGCDFAGNGGCPGVNPPFDYVPASQAAYDERLAAEAEVIRGPMHSPDILLIQEAEDQDICTVSGGALVCGATDNADGKPDTLQELALTIAAQGGPAYDAAYDRDGADDRGIVAAFMYRTDRVTLASAGTGVLSATPGVSYRAPGLAYNADVSNPKALNADLPADVDTSTGVDGSDVYTRAPQVAKFLVAAAPGSSERQPIWAVSNHFSSTPDARVGQRTEQAKYGAAIAAAITDSEPQARIVYGGDLNVFPRPDDPIATSDSDTPSDQLGPCTRPGCTTCGTTWSPTLRRPRTPTSSRVRPRRSTTSSSTRRSTPTWWRCARRTSTPAGRPTSAVTVRVASATTTRRSRGSCPVPSCASRTSPWRRVGRRPRRRPPSP